MTNEGQRSVRISGNVLDQLGLEPQAALELKLKAELHQAILGLIRKQRLKRRDLERIWDVPQPRVSEFMRGKLSTLSIGKMLHYARLLGAYANISLKTSGKAA
ncbi:MAG TPA: XRE family transcriptional regulator [Terriglobales bacterium]